MRILVCGNTVGASVSLTVSHKNPLKELDWFGYKSSCIFDKNPTFVKDWQSKVKAGRGPPGREEECIFISQTENKDIFLTHSLVNPLEQLDLHGPEFC